MRLRTAARVSLGDRTESHSPSPSDDYSPGPVAGNGTVPLA